MSDENLPPLERMLQGAARRVGAGAVHPFEIRDRVLEAFEASVVGHDVANAYTVTLHPVDIRSLAPALGGLRIDVARAVARRRLERGLRMLHEFQLEFVPDAETQKGTFRVASRFAHAPSERAPSGPTRRIEPVRGLRVRLEGGETIDVAYLPFSIGRASDNDLALGSLSLSRHHAEIVHGESGIEIRDRGSANGVFVEGRRVSNARIGDGLSVTVGDVVLRFERDA